MSSVKLISHTTCIENSSTTLLDIIAKIARVSNPTNENNTATSEKLINYLIKHHHWSPFEMVNICLEIRTTRDIARQILRHRSFSFQEFSQRYANVEDITTESVVRETRLQDTKNRQNSIETDDAELSAWWSQKQKEINKAATEMYTEALKRGIAKEQARAILPEGNTPSRLYMNGSLRSWMHYIQIRSSCETQKEHREIAVGAAEVISAIFPPILGFLSLPSTEPPQGGFAKLPPELNNIIQEYTTPKKTIKLYYADWCGWCEQINVVWNELKQEYKNNKFVTILEINCSDINNSDIKQLLNDANIDGFPTITKNDSQIYSGNRTKSELKQFIESD